MVMDKYGNKMCFSEMSIVYKFLMLYSLSKLMNSNYQPNECATTLQDDIDATGLISVPHLKLMAILWVRIECPR